MRLLPVRADHGRGRILEGLCQTDRRRHRREHYQYLPLRYVCASAPAASAAGGLVVGIAFAPDDARAATISKQPWDDNDHAPHELDAWIAIDPDDSILIRYQRSEMGQGSMTALPMIIAEELQCDWSKVRIEYASSTRSVRENRVYGDMFSHGSMSVRQSQKKMQQVGASARERLIAAAAARWKVTASECVAAQSVVTHRPGTRDQNTCSVHLHSPTDTARRLGAQDRRIGQVRNRCAGPGHGLCRHQRLPRARGQAQERR